MEQVKTPTAITQLIEGLAEERAAKIRTLSKATVVLVSIPEWGQVEEINAWYGLPINQIKELAAKGQVIAKKTNPTLTGSAVIFKTADVRKAIGKMMDYSEWLRKRPDLKNAKKGE